jgi:glutamine synthetase
LIDRGLYSLRPDLKITGRTLLGGLPPRHQQLEDHYFGKIPTRILAAMSECEMELYKLGVPVKTRHNEVAPAQFELAPIFEEAMIAVDHNLLTMDVLHRVAHRHKLKVLFHEKPFKGVNGSGKHCNWSMSTDTGENLLEPTAHPETNYRFLLFLVAILKALADHGGLLRAGIASASNEHRLGAHEAPPGIISAFLGDHLNDVLNSIEEERPLKVFGSSEFHSVRVGGTVLDLKVATLPNIARDLTDRNRTSPFAFTGNKFEFRAVGSKQSVSFPVTLLNSAIASSLQAITADLKKQMGDKKYASEDDMRTVIKKYIKETKKVRFEGDNYSDAWVEEAKKRGLPNIDNCPDAFAQLQDESHSTMLHRLGIFSPSELNSRYHILMEKYAKDIQIEAETLRTMLVQSVLPCAFAYRRELAETATLLKSSGTDSSPEKNALNELSPIVVNLQKSVGNLERALEEFIDIQDITKLARAAHDSLFIRMEEARSYADKLERIVADKHWPFPKYTELFLNI